MITSSKSAPTPTWTIRILSVVLFFLIAGLFSFVVDDLNDIGAPSRIQILEQSVDMELSSERDKASADLKTINRKIEATGADIEQLKRAGADFSKQKSMQENQVAEKTSLDARLQEIEKEFAPQDKKYRAEWGTLWSEHRLWVAVYKLSFIIPMFILASWLRSRHRNSAMRPIFTSLLVASFWHLGIIAGDHFPDIVFKYIAIAVGIAIVLASLVHLLRRAFEPRDLDLLKLRRESYANNICSCCRFPVRRNDNDNYTCPSCGTQLFGSCNSCQTTRHSLLPYCGSCGAE
ncbi:MAG: zinc ribbon domain-containing protein [Planctomycetota bacterium]|nr:zinc ribbon domain-containing protein [Planctomycetota bacterium]